MPGPARAGALIYAKDLQRLSNFYQQLLAMRLQHADAKHHVIASDDMQLIIHAIAAHIAATLEISTPPAPREEQAIKLFFTVDSLARSGCNGSRPTRRALSSVPTPATGR